MPKHLTPTTGHSAPAEFWGDPQAAVQVQAPEKPFVPLSARKRPAPLASIGALAKFRDVIEFWHAELGSKAVQAAAADLHESLTVAESAKAAVTSIPAEQRAEEATIAAAAREDADSGERRPVAERVDWTAEKAYREQRWALAFDAAAKASTRYRAVVASEAPCLIPDLIDRAAKAREAARPALRKAQEAIAKATAATNAIYAADAALGLQPRDWHLWPADVRTIAAGVESLSPTLRWIEAAETSPLLSGEYVLETGTEVPEHTLRALAESDREFDRDYVLPNILHATGRDDEIRDDTFRPDPDFREVHINSKRLPR